MERFQKAHISPHSSVYEPKMIRLLSKAGETMQALNALSGSFVNEDASEL